MTMQEKCAVIFCAAIKDLAANQENLDNLESYLSHHFIEWMKRYANTPVGLAYELSEFARMKSVEIILSDEGGV